MMLPQRHLEAHVVHSRDIHLSMHPSTQTRLPPYNLSEPTPGTDAPRSITIEGWEITSRTTHIMNATQIDQQVLPHSPTSNLSLD